MRDKWDWETNMVKCFRQVSERERERLLKVLN